MALWAWLIAIRPVISMMASLLVLVSFQIADGHLHNALIPAITVFFLSAATMELNNYCDRKHDLLIGRQLAYKHPLASLIYAYCLWIVGLGLVCYCAWINHSTGYLLVGLGLSAIGIGYSHLRHFLMTSALATALAGAGVILFPWVKNPDKWYLGWWFLAGVAILFARETIKDLFHAVYDKGWKQTLASVFGWEVAINTAQLCLAGAYFIVLGLRPHLVDSAWTVFIIGLAVVINLVRVNFAASYYLLDLTMLGFCGLSLAGGKIAVGHQKLMLGTTGGLSKLARMTPDGCPVTDRPIPHWVRPLLMVALVLVIFTIRHAIVILDTGDKQLAILEGVYIAASSGAWFAVLLGLGHRVMRPLEAHEELCTICYLVVKRMAFGMGIGIVATMLQAVVGIPVALTGVCIAGWSTACNPQLCRLLRDPASRFGVFIGLGISIGAIPAGISLGTALAIAAIWYYGYHALRTHALTK